MDLNHARLPIPPHPHVLGGLFILLCAAVQCQMFRADCGHYDATSGAKANAIAATAKPGGKQEGSMRVEIKMRGQ